MNFTTELENNDDFVKLIEDQRLLINLQVT